MTYLIGESGRGSRKEPLPATLLLRATCLYGSPHSALLLLALSFGEGSPFWGEQWGASTILKKVNLPDSASVLGSHLLILIRHYKDEVLLPAMSLRSLSWLSSGVRESRAI